MFGPEDEYQMPPWMYWGGIILSAALLVWLILWLLPQPAAAGPVAEEDLCAAQAKLTQLGLYEGEPDCHLGPRMSQAVRAFQRQRGLFVDGTIGEDTFKALMGRFPGQRGEEDSADSETPVIEGEGGDYSFEGRKCKNKTIKARGSARPWVSWARSTARKNWNQAARFEYGELFADWENAEKVGGGKDGQGVICTRASVGGVETFRCQFAGKACQAGS